MECIQERIEKKMENQGMIQSVLREVKKVIIGKDDIIVKTFMAFLAKGHILIEDIPGVGKTTLAIAFSRALSLENKRMQFTPDVMPSDVIGFHILNQEKEMEYREGAIFTNIFLADEINRTSSKTQSALLEVMEEGKVTVDGITRMVPDPFIVIATQNPVGSAGTQRLPESQLDRFMVRLSMGYPDITSEIRILKSKEECNPMELINGIMNSELLCEMQKQCEGVFIHDTVYQYIADLIVATRNNKWLELGTSPRGTIALTRMARASAYLNGRDYVTPQDVQYVYKDVVCHRLVLNTRAKIEQVTEVKVVDEILAAVRAPKIG